MNDATCHSYGKSQQNGFNTFSNSPWPRFPTLLAMVLGRSTYCGEQPAPLELEDLLVTIPSKTSLVSTYLEAIRPWRREEVYGGPGRGFAYRDGAKSNTFLPKSSGRRFFSRPF